MQILYKLASSFFDKIKAYIAKPEKKCCVTLLGTKTKFKNRADKYRVRIESLSAVHIAVAGDIQADVTCSKVTGSENICRIFDGPGVLGSDVYNIIAEASIFLFNTLYKEKVTTIHINGHSRGAVEAIYVAHILQQIKNTVNSIDKEVDINSLIKNCSLKVKSLLIEKFTEKYSHKIITLDEIHSLKEVFANLSFNICAIDPVPGDDYIEALPGHLIAWRDHEIFEIPAIVNHYYQILFIHEKSQCFRALLPKLSPGNTTTKVEIENMYGNHGNGLGALTVQKPKFVDDIQNGIIQKLIAPIKHGETIYDTSCLQDLVVCLIVNNMIHSSGIYQYNTNVIDEKEHFHDDWNKVNLRPLKQSLEEFICAVQNQSSHNKLSELYDKVLAIKDAFDKHIVKSTYSTGSRWLFYKNALYPRHVVTRADTSPKDSKKRNSIITMMHEVEIIEGFINQQHFACKTR